MVRSLIPISVAILWGVSAASPADTEALHRAARSGNLQDVQTLIAEGIPVDARDSVGGTPLHYAAWAGEVAVAQYLIRM